MNLGTLIASLTVETTGLQRAVVDMNKFEKKIATNSNKMVRQLGTVSAAIKRVDKNLATLATGNQMNMWEKKMLAATNKMVRSLGRVTNQTRLLRKELNGMTTAAAAATAAARKAATATASTQGGAILGGAGTGGDFADKAKKGASTMGKTISTMSMRLRSFGWLATTVFTAPLILGGNAMMKMGKDFEFAMAKIQGLVGISKAKVEDWSKLILDMGKKTSKGPLELADTLYYVASSGFKTEEALRITEMAAKGAATGMGETKDIANFLTSAMNAYRQSGLSAARAMDILTASVREGKGEPNEMARALGTILPIAAELGVSLDQIGGALASMTLITSSTSNAATYLRNVLMKLMHPSVGTQKALKGMGSSVEELLASLREKGLMPTLVRLRELTDKYGISMAKVFPNIRALLGALNLTGENLQYNEQVMKAVTESMGDFDKAFFIASQTLSFRWNAALADLKSNLIQVGVTIAKVMLPILERWVKWLSNVIQGFNNLSDGAQKTILWIARILAILGPGALIISTFGMAIGGLTTWIAGLELSLISLDAVIAATGWGLLVIAIAAATVAIIRHVKANKEFQQIQEKINSTIAGEVYKMDLLFESAKKAAIGTKQRSDAIKEINERYGQYLPYMLKDATANDNISKAQDAARKSLEAFIATKEMNLQLDKLHERIGAGYSKYFSKYIEAATKTLGPEMASKFKDALDSAIEEIDKAGMQKTASGQWKSAEIINAMFDEWITKMNASPFAKEFAKYLNPAAFQMASGQFHKLRNEVDPIIESLQQMVGVYSGVYKKTNEVADANKSLYAVISNESIKKIMFDMEASENRLNKLNETLEQQGEEFDLIGNKMNLYRSILEQLSGLEVLPEDSKELAAWIDHVGEKMRRMKGLTDEAGDGMESLTKVWENYQEELRGITYMDKYMKDHAKSYDFVGKKMELMEKYLEEIVAKGGAASTFAKTLEDGLNGIETNTFGVTEALKKMAEQFKILEDEKKVKGLSFDINAEKLKVVENTLQDVLAARIQMKNLDKASISFGIGPAIPFATVLDALVIKLWKDYSNLADIVDDEAFQRSVDLLNAQAESFGGVDIKLEAVGKQIERTQSKISKLAIKPGGMQSKELQTLITELINYKNEYIDLQSILERDYFGLLVGKLGAFDDKMQLVGVDINIVEAKLKNLIAVPISQRTKEWYGSVDNLISKLAGLRLEAEKLNDIKSTFTDLGSVFQDVGSIANSTMGDWVSWIGKLIGSLPELIDLFIRFQTAMKTAAALQKGLNAATAAEAAITTGSTLATAANTTAAAANTAAKGGEAVASATASGAKMPFPINIIAIAAGVAAVIAALATAIPRKKMAAGGIVPPGYPNDTFQASLTSGEIVIPKGKSSNLDKLKKQPVWDMNGEVRFVIEQDKLVGILKKASKQNSLY